MTLALQTNPAPATPMEILLGLQERVTDWSDPFGVASSAALLLREHLPYPSVSLYRYDAAAQQLHLVGAAGSDTAVIGARVPLGESALGKAVREGSTQRTHNAYVQPDFVRRMPGETHSELVVPVCSRDRVLGAILLDYPAPHQPAHDTEALVQRLVQPLAAAFEIDEARQSALPAERGTGRRVRLGATLAAVAEVLAGSAGLPAAMERVARGALDLVPGGSALLLLRHPERKALEVAAAAGDSPLAAGELVPLEGTVPGSVVVNARPHCSTSLGGATEKFCGDDAARGVRNALVVPLLSGGKAFGVLAVLNREGGDYSAEDTELLQSLANQAGAVDSMRLVEPLRQRLSDASAIAEVGRAMTGTLGLDEVLGLVTQAAQMLLDAQCAVVGLVSATGEFMTLAAASGTLRKSQGLSIPLHGSLMGWVVLNGEAVITESVSDDPRSFALEVRQGPGVVVPLECRGEIRGALLASRREGKPAPSEHDVDALRKLGAYAAIAIDNARLYNEQKELSARLRAQATELEGAYSELNASQERLVVSEKMAALGKLTAGIAHEINSPLGSVLNCLQLAQGYASEYQASADDPEVTAEDHKAIAVDLVETLALAEGAARRVAQFVRTIKSQTRMGEEAARPFDPAEEINATVAMAQHELRNKNVEVTVEVEEGVRLLGDPGRFAVIVQNLISNAVDAHEGRDGQIEVRVFTREEGVVMEVEDHGCGIPEEIRGRIFDYLFTTKDIGQGTGLGLSMVHSVVTSHFKGEIDLRTQVGSGTTFIITFPASAKAV